MKKKNKLTIVCVDTLFHNLAARAIDNTVKVTGCENVLVLSDRDLYPGSTWVKIKPIDFPTYSKILFKDLSKYVESPHFMVVQYDGMPIDKTYWNPDYLNYDYIGALWPWHPEGSNVGNGGFSIRSKKLATLCKDPLMSVTPNGRYYGEDDLICRYYGNALKTKGIKFAPSSLAKMFSQEIPGMRCPTYGFHGGLSMPYYLDDSHMDFYIDNLTEGMINNRLQRRIIPGLFTTNRLELLHKMVVKCTDTIPDFKHHLFEQIFNEQNLFPNLRIQDMGKELAQY
jgi:hypothetical protein